MNAATMRSARMDSILKPGAMQGPKPNFMMLTTMQIMERSGVPFRIIPGATRAARIAVQELDISSQLKRLAACISKWAFAYEAEVCAPSEGNVRRRPRIARFGSLLAALYAFLLLPGLHVLVHEREAAESAQAQVLHAVRALHRAHVHATHEAGPHEHEDSAPLQHRHPGEDGDGHGRNAPEHLAVALNLAAPLLLLPPARLHEPLDPRALIDHLYSRPKVRSHATRAPPIS